MTHMMIHVTTTCDTMETARRIARAALQARVAACANITPGIVSLFHWQGAIAEEPEVSVTFKTTETRRDALVALIGAEHPYDLPVITWEAVGSTREAETWCQEELDGSSG
jgi:periplasmic divalent cation tolerance protein